MAQDPEKVKRLLEEEKARNQKSEGKKDFQVHEQQNLESLPDTDSSGQVHVEIDAKKDKKDFVGAGAATGKVEIEEGEGESKVQVAIRRRGEILKEFGGSEGNVPLDNEYWVLGNFVRSQNLTGPSRTNTVPQPGTPEAERLEKENPELQESEENFRRESLEKFGQFSERNR